MPKPEFELLGQLDSEGLAVCDKEIEGHCELDGDALPVLECVGDAEAVGTSVGADVGSALEDTVAVGHDEEEGDEVGEAKEEAVCVSAAEEVVDGEAVS